MTKNRPEPGKGTNNGKSNHRPGISRDNLVFGPLQCRLPISSASSATG